MPQGIGRESVAPRAAEIAGLFCVRRMLRCTIDIEEMLNMQFSLSTPTLAQVLWPTQGPSQTRRALLLMLLGSVLLAISAKVSVPFYPVPMTMQTLVVLALGVAYGWRLGLATVALYLVEGAAGLPVFTSGAGLAYMLGTTGGYMLGFLPAVAITGFLAERGWDRNALGTAAAMLLGNVAIYALGLLWLGNVIGWDKPVLQYGLTPFVLGDLVKIVLAVVVLPAIWRRVGGRV